MMSVDAPGHEVGPRTSATGSTTFVDAGEHADVTVVIVTYDSERYLSRLISSIRAAAGDLSLRTVVVDNASADRSVAVARQDRDVVVVESGGNLGYAGAINVALRHVGDCDAVLVLNPDLVVDSRCIAALHRRLRTSGAGVVVPRIVNADGSSYPSLRREPSITRALGDAALGGRGRRRPGWLSETVFDASAYEHAHEVDWATGAALLVDRRVADQVGDWDEQFFLYSEETDFFRRVRAAGHSVWYEPAALVQHDQGGSGTSVALQKLLAVNRVRYARKYGGRLGSLAFHGVVVVHEAVRATSPQHRAVLGTVASPATWPALPRAERFPSPRRVARARGAVLVHAHDDSTDIGRTLAHLAPLAAAPEVDVVVVTTGRRLDGAAEVARATPGVRVVEVAVSSTADALTVADAATDRWPRLYLDADAEITTAAVLDTLDALAGERVVAGRPHIEWDVRGSSPIVRAYYRAHGRLVSSEAAVRGAGVWGVSSAARDRLGASPMDSLVVDERFSAEETTIVDTDAVRVRAPRTTSALVGTLRARARPDALRAAAARPSTLSGLLRTVRGPVTAADATVFAALDLWSHRAARRRPATRERDASARTVPTGHRTDFETR